MTTLCAPTVLKAGCKANLYLRITGRRDDGYHELESLFIPLAEPGDRLLVESTPDSGLEVSCSIPELSGPDNTLNRCYQQFTARTGWAPGLRIRLEKNIPLGAGLGGGSSDAAALLVHLNALCPPEDRLSRAQMQEAAKEIGADVPFFLTNTPAWVTGIGEKVSPVTLAFDCMWVLVVCPELSISTAEAFRAWDAIHTGTPEQPGLTGTVKRDNTPACASGRVLWNSFEAVIFRTHPDLREVKRRVLECGASGAVLSGSGASIIGLFRDRAQCTRAAHDLADARTATFVHPVGSCWGVAKR